MVQNFSSRVGLIPLISKNNIIKEYKELNKNLDHQLGEVQSGLKDDIVKTNTAAEGREKILEAKIEDMEDRLRQCYLSGEVYLGEYLQIVDGIKVCNRML